MSAKQNSYLVQLRDQIASTFDLEELKALAFELNLDWDELHGSRKTTRTQDLITQLARNGRLKELVELLQKERLRTNWPSVPPVEQQQQDIRTAFPKKPIYQQTWAWTSAIVLLVVIGISITTWFGGQTTNRINQLPNELAAAIPTDTPIPLPTITLTPSPTPLPFLPATEEETLIVIATFYRAEGLLQNAEVHNEIRRAIQANIDELNLGNDVQVKVEPTVLRTDNRDQAEVLGKRYNATLIIWGEETSARIEVSFLNLKEPDFDAAEATISETEKNQIASISNPDAYSAFVLEELPGQLNFLSFFALGQTAFSQENYEEAIELIETAVATIPDSTKIDASELGIDDAHFRLGWLYQAIEQLPLAMAAYDQTIILNPEYIFALNNRGNAYKNQGEYEKAIADYDQAIALDSENAEPFNNRGNAYADLGEYERAIADYDRAIALNSENAPAFYNRGLAYDNLGEYERAIADYDRAIALNSENAPAFNNRGNIYAIQGQYKRAIAEYDQAIALNPEHALAFNNRGLAYFHLGENEKAVADFGQAVAFNPEYAEALNHRGAVYFNLGEYERAILDYDQAIALNSEYANAYYNRGLAYHYLGEYEKAVADYDQTIAFNPEYAPAFSHRGVAYLNLGEYGRAIADYDQAIAFNPEYANAYYNRGAAYELLGEYEQAIADYDQAITLNPEFASAFRNRGFTNKNLQRYEQALADFQTYIKLEPQSTSVTIWNNVCWFGSILDLAEDVVFACNNAVSLSEDAQTEATSLDSRGLNRALLGDFDGAISDFQSFVDYFQDIPDAQVYVEERISWISSLSADQNPFDAETLEKLLDE